MERWENSRGWMVRWQETRRIDGWMTGWMVKGWMNRYLIVGSMNEPLYLDLEKPNYYPYSFPILSPLLTPESRDNQSRSLLLPLYRHSRMVSSNPHFLLLCLDA